MIGAYYDVVLISYVALLIKKAYIQINLFNFMNGGGGSINSTVIAL